MNERMMNVNLRLWMTSVVPLRREQGPSRDQLSIEPFQSHRIHGSQGRRSRRHQEHALSAEVRFFLADERPGPMFLYFLIYGFLHPIFSFSQAETSKHLKSIIRDY